MKRSCRTWLVALGFLASIPLLAQPTIPAVACTSSSLSGTYELLLNGRQVTAGGSISKLFQATGTAAFDGLSKITFTMTANSVNTTQAFGTPLVYSGTYSLQSNCQGTISITTGDTATFTLIAYNQGKTFAVIGSDTTFAYNGTGNLQPTTPCAVSTLNGVHEFSGNGNGLAGTTINGVTDVAGVLTFDGAGNLTGNWTVSSNAGNSTIGTTGTYTVTSACLATATLADAAGNKYAVALSIYGTAPDFVLTVSNPQQIFSGSGSAAQTTTATKTCSAASLTGTYEFTLSGRQISTSGTIAKVFNGLGKATFDGASQVTLTMTANTNTSPGAALVYSGSYTVQPNCQGVISIATGTTATFQMVAYSVNATTLAASAFTMVGMDTNYAYSGSGTTIPAACITATLSGPWPFNATGNALSGTSVTAVSDVGGLFQFDGQGNVTASWTTITNTATSTVAATGTYTLSSACMGSATVSDSTGTKYVLTMVPTGVAAGNFALTSSSPQLLFQGTGHTAVVNPGQGVVNAASFSPSETPAGSVFSVFGAGLAPSTGQPTAIPLPTTFLTTTVTINGEAAPLFYVSGSQINAQMPEDIQPGLATVIVKVGNTMSNAAAVTIPASGTPGIIVFGGTRAVVTDNGAVVTTSAPAKVGDTLVAYFTGGGPVMVTGPSLVTGAPTPGVLFPLSAQSTVAVAGKDAKVNYIGLTPGSIGLYQANFVLPQVAAGDRQLVITIAGKASNNPVIAVGN